MDEIYEYYRDQILENIKVLKRRHLELVSLVQEVERNIECVKNSKDERVREIRNAVELMIVRLENQLKNKVLTLMSQRNKLSQETEILESMIQEIENDIRSKSKSELILENIELIKKCKHFNNRKPMTSSVTASSSISFASLNGSNNFISELVPQYDTSTFTIHNFSQFQHKADPIYSPPLNVNGLSWRLKVYPGLKIFKFSQALIFLF